MSDRITQTDKVLAYLKVHGTIDRAQALNVLHIFNLPEVVRKLRAQGVDVVTYPVKGKAATYCRYGLRQ